jgi:hypothetical protein
MVWASAAGFPAYFSRFGPDYRDVEDTLPRMMKVLRIHRALVFIGGKGYYATGFVGNRLDLQGDIVFARDLGGSADRRLMAQYPGRHYYSYQYVKNLKDAALSEIRIEGTRLAFHSLHEPDARGASFGRTPVCSRPPGRRRGPGPRPVT